jgi:hypothetical protein
MGDHGPGTASATRAYAWNVIATGLVDYIAPPESASLLIDYFITFPNKGGHNQTLLGKCPCQDLPLFAQEPARLLSI